MNKSEFLNEVADFLEREDAISEDMVLENIEEWDSMARLSFLSFVDSDFGLNLSNDQLKACNTVADLVALVSDKFEG